MGKVYYDVPMIKQGQNPICWVACAAMILSFKKGVVITIGSINNGFDPSNSSIGNQAPTFLQFYLRLGSLGFSSINPKLSPGAGYIEDLLANHGPILLTHYVKDLPYGNQWGTAQADITKNNPNASHAVVITGIDTSTGLATINNPWGDKDQPVPISAVQDSMVDLFMQNINSIAYMR